MPSDEPYRLVIWRKVLSSDELQHEDVVRIAGTEEGLRFSVRRRPDHSSRETLRLRELVDESEANFETGANVFYDLSVRLLAEQGLLLKRLYADVNEYDVWATQDRAWSRREGKWLPLASVPLTAFGRDLLDDEIPEDAALVWRLVPKEEEEVSF